MKDYFEKNTHIIENSVASIDETVFNQLVEECVQALKAGHKIVVSGLGKNVPVCEKFVGTMNSLGMLSYFMNTNSAVHGDIGVVSQGDLVIVLTKSGETVESVYLVSLLKQRKCNLWLLSFRESSTLARDIPKHLILSLSHEGDLWNIVPNNSTTVNLIVLQGLAISLAKKMEITLQQFKANHPGGFIGAQLENV